MRTIICGIHPRGKANELRVFKPCDQLLKVRKSKKDRKRDGTGRQ